MEQKAVLSSHGIAMDALKRLTGVGLLLLVLLLPALVVAQPYAIGVTTITFNDPDRNNRAIEAVIQYPAFTSGTGVPVAQGGVNGFPVVVFGHGFVMVTGAYENVWKALVPEGFVVVLPNTEGSLSPSHEAFAKDIAFLARTLRDLSANPSSIFYQRLDTLAVVMGHSMGGGAAHLAASYDQNIKGVATLAPAETNPSAITAAGLTTIPTLIFAGSLDCVTPPAQHQLPIYQALQSLSKTYISIVGGSHCQMAALNTLCNFGEVGCTPASVSREKQHQIIFRYLIPWLRFVLYDDVISGAVFDQQLLTDTTVTWQYSAPLVNVINPESSTINIKVFPNPANDFLWIESDGLEIQHVIISDLSGRNILDEFGDSGNPLPVFPLKPGTYLLTVFDSAGVMHVRRFIKI